MSVVNQKEYLKRYLSRGDAKKKKKKKRGTKTAAKTASGIRIVEDIVDLPHVLDRDRADEGQDIDELNPFMEFGEDAPQIAAIIDERPAHIRSKELFSSAKWKALGADDQEEAAAHAVDKTSRTPERGSKPPRRHDSSDSDLSPVRRPAAADSDLSPPRADSKTSSEHHRRTRHDSSDTDDNDARDRRRVKTDSDGDLSPPRARGKAVRKARDSDSDLSPPRTKLKLEVSITAETPRSKSSSLSSSSKPRPKGRVGGGSDSEESGTSSRRTLSGLKAGLGDAKAIRKEAMAIRDKENRMLERMGPQMSGKDAETVVRDRRTGRKRDLKEERRRQREEEAKDAERQEKYMEWGMGLKQKEEREAKLDEDLYEMSKPLARYSDDVDLERHLKGQLREGDPMRDYVAKRKNKEEQRTKKVYQGPPPPPNRFDIPPGYRWDGVDRSNGFEAKYFKQQASKQAAAEEAYKWSVQDM